MRPTVRLLQSKVLLTLFTRQNCSLCDTAKSVIQNVRMKKNLDFLQVDVMAPDQAQWRLLYELDVPVVRAPFPLYNLAQLNSMPKLHVQCVFPLYSKVPAPQNVLKLMHRFDERKVEELIDEAEGRS